MNIRIHPLLWLIIPLLIMLAEILAELSVPEEYKPAFYSETGPVERMQGLVLLGAFYFALRLIFRVKSAWLKLWFGLAGVCCLYVGGEEISWGQHYFGWVTPEYWDQFNDQSETNLHNTSDWLDQKPRILLELGVLVGGLIIPALKKWKPEKLPARFAPIYPTWHLAVTSGLALFIKLSATVQDIIHDKFFHRPSEVLEIYLYYFVLIYLIAMWRRFGRDPV